MWKDIRVTLYDIFGYLLPGAIPLGGLFLCWNPWDHLQFLHSLGRTEVWILLLLAAYYFGHMMQAIGNGLECLIGDPVEVIVSNVGGFATLRRIIVEKKLWLPIQPSICGMVESQLRKVAGVTLEFTNDEAGGQQRARWLYRCSAAAIAQHGHGDQREMYEYREGFYRGAAVAFLLLSIVLLLTIQDAPKNPDHLAWIIAAALLSLLAAILSFGRYFRFSQGRVENTLLGFLVLANYLPLGAGSDGRVP